MANQMVLKQTIILFDCGVGRQKKRLKEQSENNPQTDPKDCHFLPFFIV